MNRFDCPQCSTGCPGNNYNGYADPGVFGHCGCSCHRLPSSGVHAGIAPTQIDVDALAALLRDKEAELHAAAVRMRQHLSSNTDDADMLGDTPLEVSQ